MSSDDSISLVEYSLLWPEMAELEIQKIKAALPVSLIQNIEHVGSPATLKEYQQLKSNLALEFRHDREAYTVGKSAFIQKVIRFTEA